MLFLLWLLSLFVPAKPPPALRPVDTPGGVAGVDGGHGWGAEVGDCVD
jgi:hypothetical protein